MNHKKNQNTYIRRQDLEILVCFTDLSEFLCLLVEAFKRGPVDWLFQILPPALKILHHGGKMAKVSNILMQIRMVQNCTW